jgi:hypothetical protein
LQQPDRRPPRLTVPRLELSRITRYLCGNDPLLAGAKEVTP